MTIQTKSLFAGLILWSSLAVAAPVSQVQASDDSVIIYGGVGFLSKQAQPIFHAIFEQGRKGQSDHRRKLENATRAAVENNRFHWTRSPVLFSVSDAVKVMRTARAAQGKSWQHNRVRISDLQDVVGRVYTLAVVADLELDFKSPPAIKGDRSHGNMVAASMTALLVDMDTKEIMLSASHVGHLPPLMTDGRFLPRRQVTAMMLDLYRQTAAGAVAKLARKMKTTGPSEEFNRYMVTGTLVTDKRLRSLFGLGPWQPDRFKSICKLPPQCSGTGTCAQLTGYASALTSSALSDAGKLVLPAIHWTHWAERSTNLIALNLSQPRGGVLEEPLAIKLAPEQAEVKMVVRMDLSKPVFKGKTGGNVGTITRLDNINVKLLRYTTDADDCRTGLTPHPEIRTSAHRSSKLVAAYKTVSPAMHRLFALDALHRTKDGITQKIRTAKEPSDD